MLLEELWGGSDYREPRTIDVHVRHLREKLERDPREPGVHPHRARRRLPLPRPMNPFRSVGARLSLALLVVVAGALALVYLIVVPSLEQRLIDAKLNQLRAVMPQISDRAAAQSFDTGRTSSRRVAAADARVVVYRSRSPAAGR